MTGHDKWSKVERPEGVTDSRRVTRFSGIARRVVVAGSRDATRSRVAIGHLTTVTVGRITL